MFIIIIIIFVVVVFVQVVPVGESCFVVMDLLHDQVQHLSLGLDQSCLEHAGTFQVHTVSIPGNGLVALVGNRLRFAVQFKTTFA